MSVHPEKKTVIVTTPGSHGNTGRVAAVMAEVLHAEIVDLEHADPDRLMDCDLVGFGSGVYRWQLDRGLLGLLRRLPHRGGRAAFLFATSGFAPAGLQRYFAQPVRLLEEKGLEVVGTFDCRGWDTSPPFNLVRGIRRAHPDPTDLAAARAFAERLGDHAGRRR